MSEESNGMTVNTTAVEMGARFTPMQGGATASSTTTTETYTMDVTIKMKQGPILPGIARMLDMLESITTNEIAANSP